MPGTDVKHAQPTASPVRVLIADNDEPTRALARTALSDEAEVLETADGLEVLQLLAIHPIDVVLLALGLPSLAGFELVACVRDATLAPILILTGRVEVADRVRGLDLGADDYITKPFAAAELAARVRAALRHRSNACSGEVLEFGDLVIDGIAHEARVGGRPVPLTPTELNLLRFLARSPGRAFSRSELLVAVWASSPEWQTTATVTEHVRRLRDKIETDPSQPTRIVTVRGIGYRFDPDQ